MDEIGLLDGGASWNDFRAARGRFFEGLSRRKGEVRGNAAPMTLRRFVEAWGARDADAVAAQQLAPATVDPSANTAYLQIPLPGGQSAEIHVTRDGGDGHEDADRVSSTRIAFLLTMSSLGPLMVDATVADDGVEAVVRAHNADVDAFLTERADELADALGNALGIEGGARVQVRSGGAPAPSRLLAGPPSTGLDVQA